MKKLLSLLLALALCISLCACGTPAGPDSSAGQPSGTTQPSSGSNPSGKPNSAPEKAPTPPTEPFDPLGTWVWEGAPSLTLTLNEDGTVVYNDPEGKRMTYNWFRDENVQTTWVYNESEQQIVITYVDPDGTWSIDPQPSAVTGDLGYYMIDGGEYGLSFVRAENYEDAHAHFLDLSQYHPTFYANKEVVLNQPMPLVDWRDGDTITITDAVLTEFGGSNGGATHHFRFYFTLSVTEAMRTPSDFFDCTWKYAAEGGESRDCLIPYDLNGNEITSIPAGSTVEGYCELDLWCRYLHWFGEPYVKIGLNGQFAFYLPSDTIDYN